MSGGSGSGPLFDSLIDVYLSLSTPCWLRLCCAGIVILMLDNKMEPAVARNMVKGLPDTLHSEFRLSYSMLLNLQRGEGRLKAQELLAASFKQFQVEQALPALKQKVQQLQVTSRPSSK